MIASRNARLSRLLLEASRYLSGELASANTSLQARDIALAAIEHKLSTRNGVSLYAIIKEFNKRQGRKLS